MYWKKSWPCLPFSLVPAHFCISLSTWGIPQALHALSHLCGFTPALPSWTRLPPFLFRLLLTHSIKFCRLLFQKIFLQSLGSPVPLFCAPLASQAGLCPSTFIVMPTLSDDLESVSPGAGLLKDGRHQLPFILVSPDLRVALGTQQSHICLLSCNSRLCPPRWLFWQTEDLSLSQRSPHCLPTQQRTVGRTAESSWEPRDRAAAV